MNHHDKMNVEAIEFGKTKGWSLSKSVFDFKVLSEGKIHCGSRDSFGDGTINPSYHSGISNLNRLVDHAYYYRKNKRAVAIAAHLYDYPNVEKECRILACRFNLIFDVPDYVSWWNPGLTTLVLYVGPAAEWLRWEPEKYLDLRAFLPNAPRLARKSWKSIKSVKSRRV